MPTNKSCSRPVPLSPPLCAAVRRFRHAFAVFQGFFGAADTDVLQHFFRTDARPCGKFALQVLGTDVHCCRHLRQIGLLGGMVVKVFDGAGNARELAGVCGGYGVGIVLEFHGVITEIRHLPAALARRRA